MGGDRAAVAARTAQAEGRPSASAGAGVADRHPVCAKSGLPWEMLPAEMGCGAGMSCWRRLSDWQEAGVRAALHRVLLERLQAAGQIDWRRAALDSASVPPKGGDLGSEQTRPTAASRAPSVISRSMPGAHHSAC